jgi:hypothetical protein
MGNARAMEATRKVTKPETRLTTGGISRVYSSG